ncbi:LLM class flavin-dependent oxidoreductase [Prauserella cavernicola]|uniref:LLM class flavin-dependent oxidoreductase n=1 Tax=Prauserella cavernicola TaxID=2800127 RepID=A0A934QQP0_9PSEU|nr:LLM class flavin-dependent oxidoreductase [Prauserella cavernicola]MBK1783713.1 LLM class flavin-dependent oxidoreductase [Prauserella cavernicola]
MTVEFVGMIGAAYYSETQSRPSAAVDPAYLRRFARAYDDGGFDWTLVPYSSAAAESNQLAAAVLAQTERLKVMLAHRPGVLHPANAARAFATLDQLSDGRLGIHILAGGNDTEQRREGDYLSKDERYERAAEYIGILRDVWSAVEPRTHFGTHYRFEDYRSDVVPVRGGIPVSVGGSSEAAYRVGGRHGDIFGLWGEPLRETAEQIAAVHAHADAVGRPRPRIWVSFRPIIAPTDELAWERAERILGGINHNFAATPRGVNSAQPQNAGSQRLVALAERSQVYDRALWMAPAAATNGAGSSTALVGSPETVAKALLDYVDIGCELLSIRGYDPLNDAIDLARYVLPLVRSELPAA